MKGEENRQGRGTFITRRARSRKIGLVLPGIVPYSEYFQPIVSELTRGLMRTLTELGLKVPGDVMVAGFDDMHCARVTTPALTTIHQPYAQIAEMAFRRLVDRIARPQLPPITVSLPAPLVVRGSTDRMQYPKRGK